METETLPGCSSGMADRILPSDGTVHPVILELEGVIVDFNGFKALNINSFYVDRGELRFLIGPNGAGKTTMLDVICRKVDPIEGELIYEGITNLKNLSISQVAQIGISRKFQAPTVFSKLSVWQNLELAFPRAFGVWRGLSFRLRADEKDKIESMLKTIGLFDHRQKKALELSHGQKQWLELGMTLIQKPKLLMVDEPVAGMTESERNRTGELLHEAAKTCSVLVVEHDMNFVKKFSKSVTVLHEGRVLCEGSFDTVSTNQAVIDVYLGRGATERGKS